MSNTLNSFRITTDACSETIRAHTIDQAARHFARGEQLRPVADYADLESAVSSLGGWVSYEDEGPVAESPYWIKRNALVDAVHAATGPAYSDALNALKEFDQANGGAPVL
jgi:hypothetical protein